MDKDSYSDVLLALVQGDTGAKWAEMQVGWNRDSPEPVCSWRGVKCDPIDLTISEIDLSSAELQATLPSEWGMIPSLRKLNLSDNQFRGTVPSEVLALPQLDSVIFAANAFSGSFPLFASSSLEMLDVTGNKFSGSLPNDIALRYPTLIFLDLSNNAFLGTFPEELTAASNLVKLNLAFNQLHGLIPHNIGKLKDLAGLFLNDNAFYGPIPESLREMSNLMQLFLQHNQLSGTIPETLSEIQYLKDLFLDGNKLTGVVPIELCNQHYNDKYFSEVPGANQRSGCESLSCPENFKSSEGVFPCEECPAHKYTPYLGWNGMCVNIQERHILDALYQETRGPEWKKAERWANPNVPYCLYEGVDCNDAGNIVNITLSDMNLQGWLPEKLGRLPHLRVLNLGKNKLSGIVPSDLRFPPLEHLDLSDNQFWGPLPPLLCQKEGINGNGENGVLTCDVITCPSGTWSTHGRATDTERHCLPCSDNQYLGQSRCNKVGIAAVQKADQYVRTHSWPLYILIILTVSFGALAAYLLWVSQRRAEARSEKLGHPANETYYDEDGVYEGNGFEQEEEELAVIQYPTGSSNEDANAHLPIDDPAPSSTQTADISRGRGRTAQSPDDDPDTQDLWLDVPKIA